jgi:predicted nucleic acid-binding protein
MKTVNANTKIILDADVIIHFLKAGHIGVLTQIYPNQLFMPDVVFNETFFGKEKTEVENLLKFKLIHEIVIKSDLRIFTEYNRLTKLFGKGESACMAYCRFTRDAIGSSNLKDIRSYCEEHQITYLTTLDFIAMAFQKKLLTEAECDYFIYLIDPKKRLPVERIVDYL